MNPCAVNPVSTQTHPHFEPFPISGRSFFCEDLVLSAGGYPGLSRARQFFGRLELGFNMRRFQVDGRQTRFRERVGGLGLEQR